MGSSLLLGIDGLILDRVLIDDAGRRVVHCSTEPELAGWCPACRQQSSSPKERVTTRPRDVRIGPDRPVLLWHKRKWRCRAAAVSIGDHCRPIARARSRVDTLDGDDLAAAAADRQALNGLAG